MKANAFPAAATRLQLIVPCQWLTSTPSRYAVVASVRIAADGDDELETALTVAAESAGTAIIATSAAMSRRTDAARRRSGSRRGRAAGGRRDTVTGLR